MKHYDAFVIGAGPAGASAALYLARFGWNIAVAEKLSTGGLLLQTADIENYPGFPKGIQGYELADALEAHLTAYPMRRYTDEVTQMDLTGTPRRLRVGEEWVTADAVVITAGVRYRKLGVPGEEKYLGRGLSHCALCDGNFFRNQVVGVVGGGNSALEESLYLSRIVKHIHLMHRRDEFRASQNYVAKVEAQANITLERSTIITALHGEKELEAVTVKRLHTGGEERIPMQGLFVFVGFEPVRAFIPETLAADAQGFLITDVEMKTNIPGVFAAGDIRSKLCRQIATAVGDGVTAANSAHIYLEHLHA